MAVYAALAPPTEGVLAAIYLWTIPSYYIVACGLVMAITMPLIWHRWLRLAVGVLVWIWLGFLLMDLVVFNLYQFHIDLFLVQMLFADFRGLGLPLPVFVAALATLAVLAYVVRLFFKASRIKARGRVRLNRLALALAVLGVPVFFANQAIHAWADRYDRERITQYTPYFPLYFPVYSGDLVDMAAQRMPAITPSDFEAKDPAAALRKAGPEPTGRLHYPKTPFACEIKQKPHILLVVIESWQAATLHPEVMPNAWKLAQQSTMFLRHVSSGSATVPGFFGLMYGLHPSYYESFRSQARLYPSPLTDVAHQLGYQVRVFTSGDFERFSLRSMFFPKVDPANFHAFGSDRELVAGFQRIAGKATGDAPLFDIVFLTSSHSPYSYPPSHKRFAPTPAVKGAYVLNKQIDAAPFRNEYKNSLHYVDDELGKLLDAKRSLAQLSPSWIVITGDHAEEFNESGLGLWGHGSSFSRWQTATPLIVKRPYQASGKTEDKPSFHQDIAPTLMREAFGCSNALADFSNGASLFDLPPTRNTVISSYVSHAYWMNGVVLERNTGRRYDWSDMSKTVKGAADASALRGLLEEETRFYRP